MSCNTSNECRYNADGSFVCPNGGVYPGSSGLASAGIENFTGAIADQVKQAACKVVPGMGMCLKESYTTQPSVMPAFKKKFGILS